MIGRLCLGWRWGSLVMCIERERGNILYDFQVLECLKFDIEQYRAIPSSSCAR